MAQVLHLFTCLRHRLPMRSVEEALAIADKGFEHCAHGRPGSKRQILLMDCETLAEFKLEPGQLKENITTEGIRLRELARGQHLRVGDALLEVTISCEPCGRMDDIRRGLQEALRGKRGMLCRVLKQGLIRRGDKIELIHPEKIGE